MHRRHSFPLFLALIALAGTSIAQAPPSVQGAPVAPSASPELGSTALGPPVQYASTPAAQAVSLAPTLEAYTVELTSDMPELGYEVYARGAAPGKDRPLISCPRSCRIILPRGDYDIRVQETDETLAGTRPFTITHDTTIRFDPDTKTKRTAGLILGITGPVAIVSGFVMLISSIHLSDEHEHNDEDRARAGALLLLAGLGATPVGWVMFGTSRRPEFEISGPSNSISRAPKPSLSFGALPTRGGVSLGGTLVF